LLQAMRTLAMNSEERLSYYTGGSNSPAIQKLTIRTGGGFSPWLHKFTIRTGGGYSPWLYCTVMTFEPSLRLDCSYYSA